MSANISRRLTVEQKLLLADAVRSALVGWMISCPRSGQTALRIQYQSTTAAGFSFSRFAQASMRAFGRDYHPMSPALCREFPLSIAEATALANDVELELATDDELYSAGLIAAHSPFGQPEVCSSNWKVYVGAMRAIGIEFLDGDPSWKSKVRSRLQTFRRHVAYASQPVAAE